MPSGPIYFAFGATIWSCSHKVCTRYASRNATSLGPRCGGLLGGGGGGQSLLRLAPTADVPRRGLGMCRLMLRVCTQRGVGILYHYYSPGACSAADGLVVTMCQRQADLMCVAGPSLILIKVTLHSDVSTYVKERRSCQGGLQCTEKLHPVWLTTCCPSRFI